MGAESFRATIAIQKVMGRSQWQIGVSLAFFVDEKEAREAVPQLVRTLKPASKVLLLATSLSKA